MSKRPLLGGLPLHRWVGRRVLLGVTKRSAKTRSNRRGNGAINAQLISIAKRKAVVKPMGHRNTETVPLDALRPWWSKNPDLKQEYDRAQQSKKKS